MPRQVRRRTEQTHLPRDCDQSSTRPLRHRPPSSCSDRHPPTRLRPCRPLLLLRVLLPPSPPQRTPLTSPSLRLSPPSPSPPDSQPPSSRPSPPLPHRSDRPSPPRHQGRSTQTRSRASSADEQRFRSSLLHLRLLLLHPLPYRRRRPRPSQPSSELSQVCRSAAARPRRSRVRAWRDSRVCWGARREGLVIRADRRLSRYAAVDVVT